MTMLSQEFETFRKALDAPEAPADAILARYKVREHVTSAWQPLRDAVIGSSRRGTSLRPTRSVDYLFVLGPRLQSYLTNDPVKALDDISSRLGVPFPHIRARRAIHGVAMPFGEVSAVLIPAFPRHGGGVFIPDTELRRWLPTDPDAHANFVAEAQRRTGSQGAMIVRALRAWRRAQQVPIRSFHLEVLVLRALTAAPASFAEGCVTAFEAVARSVKVRCAPVGAVGDDVDQYLALDPEARLKIAQAAGDAADTLRDAAAHEAQGNAAGASESARIVFGAPFPGGALPSG